MSAVRIVGTARDAGLYKLKDGIGSMHYVVAKSCVEAAELLTEMLPPSSRPVEEVVWVTARIYVSPSAVVTETVDD